MYNRFNLRFLTLAPEQATKNAEEEIKKQNELMPKKDASYIK
jgi:hypothetical protein